MIYIMMKGTDFLIEPFKVGFKSILHLAIDEDDYDTTPYIDALLQVYKHNNSSPTSNPFYLGWS